MESYICIHGHFYQPPRENPWLDLIEKQDTAAPFHDWNERITAECYAPNATARILNEKQEIANIVNNYETISFNFGATLLRWLETQHPRVYRAICDADAKSCRTFAGHGSAIAQVYNHLIMPLANRRDKITQVKWGIKDFEYRFGRFPEGMWLAETAVDIETLEILAAEGIHYTILAPHQAKRIRPLSEAHWQEIPVTGIDTRRAYLALLPSGKSISLFFYNGYLSRAVAFERLLDDGIHFAHTLANALPSGEGGLSHIATDGETYGHHHRHGEMALAYALQYIKEKKLAKLTNYGAFLAENPPRYEVEIVENTSWSCVHGIERWKSDCGCNSGGHPQWNQTWRMPLRAALDWLRDQTKEHYLQHSQHLFKDPEQARNDYINVLLQPTSKQMECFFREHQCQTLSDEDKEKALLLLEMQRNAMLMYTSCGWFFDELSGIETVQILQYAGRVIQLAEEFQEEENLEEGFLSRVEQAKSNLPDKQNGREIYEKLVRPVSLTALLQQAFQELPASRKQVEKRLQKAKEKELILDQEKLQHLFQQKLDQLATEWEDETEPEKEERHFHALVELVILFPKLPFEIDLHHIQNTFFKKIKQFLSHTQTNEQGDTIKKLGKALNIAIT